MTNLIESLPQELIEHIFEYVDLPTILSSVISVSKHFCYLCNAENTSIFRYLKLNDFKSKILDHHLIELAKHNRLHCTKSINLSNCENITTKGLEVLGKSSPNIEELCLSNCTWLNDVDLCKYIRLTTTKWLNSLDVSGCRTISDESMSVISLLCTNLVELNIKFTSVSDDGLLSLSSLQHLRILNIGGLTHVSDAGVHNILQNENNLLESIDLSYNTNITNDSIHCIAKSCTQIHTLILYRCNQITDEGIQLLFSISPRNIESLRHLNMGNLCRITDVALMHLLGGVDPSHPDFVPIIPRKKHHRRPIARTPSRRRSVVQTISPNINRLESLNIACTNITNDALLYIGFTCKSLKHLCISKCNRIDDSGLYHLSNCAKTLETLLMNECNGITDAGVYSILSENLRELDISYTNITNHTLTHMNRCVKLRKLSMKGCKHINDVGVKTLVKYTRFLQSLNLATTNITDESIIALSLYCKNLKTLDIRGKVSFSANIIFQLEQKCPNLRQINCCMMMI